MRLLIAFVFLTAAGCASAPSKENSAKGLGDVPAVPKMSAAVVNGYTMAEYRAATCPAKMDSTAALKNFMKAVSACVAHAQWSQVENYANQMAIRFSSDPWGAYFLSLSAEHAKDWSRARWMAELAVKKSPKEGVTLYQLGRVQWQMGEMQAAFTTFKSAAARNPSLVEANVLAGQLALLNDSNSEAEKYFQRAVDKDPKHFEAHMGLAEAEMRRNNWTSADENLRAAIGLHPRDTSVRIMRAQGLEQQAKDNAAALEAYRLIQKLDREHKLDAPVPPDLSSRIQVLQASVAEDLKKLSSRTPSGENKEVSK